MIRMGREEFKNLFRQNPALKVKPHKYHARRTEYRGIKYPSRKEANFAETLDTLVNAGEVVYWLRQVPFYLPGNVTYRVDFQVFWRDGSVEYYDVKGYDTPVSQLKRRQVEAIYPVKIILT